jgi:hypothetical protein
LKSTILACASLVFVRESQQLVAIARFSEGRMNRLTFVGQRLERLSPSFAEENFHRSQKIFKIA